MDVSERVSGTPLDRIAVADAPGNRLLVVDLGATVVLGVLLVAAIPAPNTVGVVAAGWSVVLFVVGCGLFLWAYAIGVQRSRTDAVSIDGLFLLTGVAPRAVRRRFLGLLAAQCIVSVAAAAARPFTTLAFGVLAPMFGLGIQGLWAARHGHFEPRPDPAGKGSGR